MGERWTLDGWFYLKAGKRIGPVTPDYIVYLIRAEELRPSDKVFQGWKKNGEYRWMESEARSA